MKTEAPTLPTVDAMTKLVTALMPDRVWCLVNADGEPVDDTSYSTEDDAQTALVRTRSNAVDAALVTDCLTVGWSPESGGWSYQTGDNSYTGGAYGHPIWAVVWINADSDVSETVDDILSQLDDQNLT